MANRSRPDVLKRFRTPECVSTANLPKRKRNLAENNTKGLLWAGLIIIGMVLADQLSKQWAVNNLSGHSSVKIIGEFLMFTLVYNRGGAMGTDLGSSNYYLIATFIILPLLLYYIYHYRRDYSFAIPLSFISAGAIGNLIDRLRFGQVVDFIDVDFFDIGWLGLTRWWTFNIADACISVAIVYVALFHIFIPFFKKKNHSPDKKSEQIHSA